MPEEGRNPHSRRIHENLVVAEDLAGLPHHLHFFLGVAVVLEDVDMGYRVEGDLLGIALDFEGSAIQQGRGLPDQFFNGASAGARYGLVGTHVDAFDAEEMKQNSLSKQVNKTKF